MPILYRIDAANRVVWARGWGVLTDRELLEAVRAARGDPRFDATFHELADQRAVNSAALTVAGLRQVAAQRLYARDSRRAVVTGDPASFGMARIYQAWKDGPAESGMLVCEDLAEALSWLGLPPDWQPPPAEPGERTFEFPPAR